jgi:hypothetical protein
MIGLITVSGFVNTQATIFVTITKVNTDFAPKNMWTDHNDQMTSDTITLRSVLSIYM